MFGATALHYAAESGHRLTADLLLERGAKRSIDAQDKSGRTALYWAAKKGHSAVVSLLLTKGANPNVKEDKKGYTALHAAIGHPDTVKALLRGEVNPNVTGKDDGKTALDLAIENGHTDVANRLAAVTSTGPTPFVQRIGEQEGELNQFVKWAMDRYQGQALAESIANAAAEYSRQRSTARAGGS
jgi:hypothetical protein